MSRITRTMPRTVSASSRPDASPALRDTGLRIMGKMPWGSHICIFYETPADLLDMSAAYFKAGLRSKEFCSWAVSDPITPVEAEAALRRAIPDLDRHMSEGRIEILDGTDWYFKGGGFDTERIIGGWQERLDAALARGFVGMRLSGNAFWVESKHWKAFCEYERELDRWLAGQQKIALCTYPLRACRAADLLDVARAHQCCTAMRNGGWEILKTPELRRAKLEIGRLNNALDVLSAPFSGHSLLTPRERIVLAQIVRGASSKEAARMLGISPRTMEFHRANVMRKLGAKNTADLVRRVLSE